MTEKEILYALTFLLGALGFWVRGWIAKVDKRLESLEDLKISVALGDKEDTHLGGYIEANAKSIADCNQNIGKLASSIGKLWGVVEDKKLKNPRVSDICGGNHRS